MQVHLIYCSSKKGAELHQEVFVKLSRATHGRDLFKKRLALNAIERGLAEGVDVSRQPHKRFPMDFMFSLTPGEKAEVITVCDHLQKLKFSKSLPFAFTERGATQAANVLASPRAVEKGIYVVRAFVRLKAAIASYAELAKRLAELEEKTEGLALSYDTVSRNTRALLKQVFDALRALMRRLFRPSGPSGSFTPRTRAPTRL